MVTYTGQYNSLNQKNSEIKNLVTKHQYNPYKNSQVEDHENI